ncbi:MAG: hypothetical protein JW715_16500 [Sedimentisphaerales bacterium]|nr:hypothetical protein [Sedimentisphaerales bacterium]
MYKKLVLSIVLICLLSSGAFGLVGQTQGFGVGADSLLLLNGSGSVYGGNSTVVGQSQLATDPGCGNVIALQTEAGILNQGASIVGSSGSLGALQNAGLGALQLQIGGLGLGLQDQDLVLSLNQDVAKNDGSGCVVAGQGGIVGQVQIVATPYGISGDAQFAGVSQYSGMGGGAGSGASISKSASVGASQ